MNPRHTLTAFRESYAAEVASWPVSQEEARAWCSHDEASLPEPTIFELWYRDPDVYPYVLLEKNRPVAYGEIWTDPAEDEVELARLIVRPSARGKGLGRKFVGQLLERAESFGVQKAYVRVIPENKTAIACYRRAGFRRVSATEENKFNAKQPMEYVWMERRLTHE